MKQHAGRTPKWNVVEPVAKQEEDAVPLSVDYMANEMADLLFHACKTADEHLLCTYGIPAYIKAAQLLTMLGVLAPEGRPGYYRRAPK